MGLVIDYLKSLAIYADQHNVNPKVFVLIYLFSFIPFYYPIIKTRVIYDVFREGWKSGLIAKKIIGAIIINRLAWVAPYVYVLVFGRNLPRWLIILIVLYLIIGLTYFIYKINKKRINDY